MPPLPNNENDRGASAPKGTSRASQGVEIELDEEFLHHGRIYGPGKLTVKDDGGLKAEDIARDLQERQDYVKDKRGSNEAVLRPNLTITGIRPGTETDDHISNALSPEDVAKMREESAAEAVRRSEAAGNVPGPRDRRTTPVSTSGATNPGAPAAKGTPAAPAAKGAPAPKGAPTSPPPATTGGAGGEGGGGDK